MKNFLTRALTGAIYVILLVGCTVGSPVSAFFFFALVAAACVWEYSQLMNRYEGASISAPLGALCAVILVAAVWLLCIGSESAPRTLALYGLLLLYLMVSELYRQAENPLRNWGLMMLGQVYVVLPLSLLPLLSVTFNEATGHLAYAWFYPLALFIFLWTNDTGAYLCGMALHNVFPAKLFPRISPKKSWVGSIGGGLLTLLVSLLLAYLLPDTMPLWKWMGFALVVVVFGTWGDLVESLLKRHLGIKDSGQILPGHGGLLDRFDSALLAIPAVVIYFLLVGVYK